MQGLWIICTDVHVIGWCTVALKTANLTLGDLIQGHAQHNRTLRSEKYGRMGGIIISIQV